jgi:hypothetical protein
MTKKTSILLICFLAVSYSLPAFASDSKKSPLDEIYKCINITEGEDRLACFDASVASLQMKEEKKELLAIDAEQAREIERDSFGLSLPSLPKIGLFSRGSDADGEKIDDTQIYNVKSYRKTHRGLIVVMQNGHVWQQSNSNDPGWIPKGDLVAKIKKASLGSFFLTLENEKGQAGRKGLRFKRIE